MFDPIFCREETALDVVDPTADTTESMLSTVMMLETPAASLEAPLDAVVDIVVKIEEEFFLLLLLVRVDKADEDDDDDDDEEDDLVAFVNC